MDNHLDKKIENILEINANNSGISGITPIKKNENKSQINTSKNISIVDNNSRKQLLKFFEEENKGENNPDKDNKNYQFTDEKNNYSKEIESILLNNMKEVKLNQTHSSYNGNESMLQNQIKELKIRSKTMKNKLTIFLKLMKKYSSKLTTLAQLSSNNNIDNNNNPDMKINSINNEIQSTLSQLNNMLNNPKLNEDIFELADLTNNNISINIDATNNNKEEEKLNFNQQSLTIPVNTNFNTNQSINKNDDDFNNIINNSNLNLNEENNYIKDIQGLINKYEEKINLLNKENKELKKSKEEQNIIQDDLYKKNIQLENEINLLKNKINEGKKNYENVLEQLDTNSKLSVNLQKKLEYLEDENNSLKKNCVELSQNLSRNNYEKINLSNIENELEYKNNIITYLEALLKKKNVNPKLLTEDIYKKEYLKNKNIRYKKDCLLNNNNNLNIKNIEEDQIRKSNNLVNDENENGLTNNKYNIMDIYLDTNRNIEGCINLNNYNENKNGKNVYSNKPENYQDLFNRNAKSFKNGEKSKNIENNTNEENINQENESRNFFSFYNWGGQTNSNSNLVEYKKISNSNFNSPKMIQKEIDVLDKEILDLQTKFKELLSEE